MGLDDVVLRLKVETILLVELETYINRFSLGIMREFFEYRDSQDLLVNEFYDMIDTCSFDDVSRSVLKSCDSLINKFCILVDSKINNIIYDIINSLRVRLEYLKYTGIDLDAVSLEFRPILTMIKNQYVIYLKLQVNKFLDEIRDRAIMIGIDYYSVIDVVDEVCCFTPYFTGESVNSVIVLYTVDKIKLYLPTIDNYRFNYINLIFSSKIMQFYLQQNNHIFDI